MTASGNGVKGPNDGQSAPVSLVGSVTVQNDVSYDPSVHESPGFIKCRCPIVRELRSYFATASPLPSAKTELSGQHCRISKSE